MSLTSTLPVFDPFTGLDAYPKSTRQDGWEIAYSVIIDAKYEGTQDLLREFGILLTKNDYCFKFVF